MWRGWGGSPHLAIRFALFTLSTRPSLVEQSTTSLAIGSFGSERRLCVSDEKRLFVRPLRSAEKTPKSGFDIEKWPYRAEPSERQVAVVISHVVLKIRARS